MSAGSYDKAYTDRFPELDLCDNDADRAQAAKLIARSMLRIWWHRVRWVPLAMIPVTIVACLVLRLPASKGWQVAYLGLCTGTTLLITVISWCRDDELRWFLRKWLTRKGTPMCSQCGYCLKGQTQSRCPECGNPFNKMPEEDNTRQTALHVAVASCDKVWAEALIANGLDVHAIDDQGDTPLQLAERNGDQLLIKLLREHQAK